MNKPEQPPKPADSHTQGSGERGSTGAGEPAAWAQRPTRDSSSFSPSLFGAQESQLSEALFTRPDMPETQSAFPGEEVRTGWPAWWTRRVNHTWIAVLFVVGLLRLALRRWIRHNPGLVSRVLETVLWPALFVFLCFISNPDNPFYINEGFPWPWLGPWLIGLRYGAGYGAAAALGLLGFWGLLAWSQQFPRLYFLGGAIATLIAGE